MRALVIEGGGMRAAYANGVLAAFEEAGFDPFDAVYGTSAGGALAAWWTAGQARHALDTWAYAQDERIMSYKRWLLRRGPLLDHDTLFSVVYEDEAPLDIQAVADADHPVIVTTTEVATGEVHYQDIREGPVLEWLKATGRLPLAAGPPVEIDGTAYLDGGLADPVPVAKAIEDGAREIVVILNRPERKSETESWLLSYVVGRRYPGLQDLVRDHYQLWNQGVALAKDPPEGVTTHIIQPEAYLGLGRLSRDPESIREAIEDGLTDGRRFVSRYRASELGGEPSEHAAGTA